VREGEREPETTMPDAARASQRCTMSKRDPRNPWLRECGIFTITYSYVP